MEEKDLTKKQTMGASLVLAIASMFFWNSWWVVPVKYLTVFFHEMSHALMTIATGGQVKALYLNLNESGRVLSMGGIPWLILSAGYLGSLVWGCILLIWSGRYQRSEKALSLMALVLCLGLWFSAGWQTKAIMFGLLTLTLFVKFATSSTTRDIFVNYFGLTSCLYVIYDIVGDIILNPNQTACPLQMSDANKLARELGYAYSDVATLSIGIGWLLVALIVIWLTLWLVVDDKEL